MNAALTPKRLTISWKYQVLLWIGYWLYSSIQSLPFYNNFLSNLGTEGVFTLGIILCVYVTLWVLIPRLLIPKKYMWFILAVLALSWGVAWITNEFLAWLFHPILIEFFSGWQGKFVLFTDTLLIIALSMTIQFIGRWRERDAYARELEKKNVETELALLKSQVNPHFVFNILNAVYHLIAKDSDKAQQLLLQFSDILSHQIYDSGKDRIPLEKEIDYLKNYIEVEEMRSEGLMELNCQFPDSVNGYEIAPMLMLPLVENAFKHSKRAEGYDVDIVLSLEGKVLNLHIRNSLNEKHHKNDNGLGLENVRRRLELLYPDGHEFLAEKKEDVFETRMRINLHEAQESDH